MNELWRIFIIYYYDVTNKIRCHDDLWNKVTNDLVQYTLMRAPI